MRSEYRVLQDILDDNGVLMGCTVEDTVTKEIHAVRIEDMRELENAGVQFVRDIAVEQQIECLVLKNNDIREKSSENTTRLAKYSAQLKGKPMDYLGYVDYFKQKYGVDLLELDDEGWVNTPVIRQKVLDLGDKLDELYLPVHSEWDNEHFNPTGELFRAIFDGNPYIKKMYVYADSMGFNLDRFMRDSFTEKELKDWTGIHGADVISRKYHTEEAIKLPNLKQLEVLGSKVRCKVSMFGYRIHKDTLLNLDEILLPKEAKVLLGVPFTKDWRENGVQLSAYENLIMVQSSFNSLDYIELVDEKEKTVIAAEEYVHRDYKSRNLPKYTGKYDYPIENMAGGEKIDLGNTAVFYKSLNGINLGDMIIDKAHFIAESFNNTSMGKLVFEDVVKNTVDTPYPAKTAHIYNSFDSIKGLKEVDFTKLRFGRLKDGEDTKLAGKPIKQSYPQFPFAKYQREEDSKEFGELVLQTIQCSFRYCQDLEKVILGKDFTHLSCYNFDNCQKLKYSDIEGLENLEGVVYPVARNIIMPRELVIGGKLTTFDGYRIVDKFDRVKITENNSDMLYTLANMNIQELNIDDSVSELYLGLDNTKATHEIGRKYTLLSVWLKSSERIVFGEYEKYAPMSVQQITGGKNLSTLGVYNNAIQANFGGIGEVDNLKMVIQKNAAGVILPVKVGNLDLVLSQAKKLSFIVMPRTVNNLKITGGKVSGVSSSFGTLWFVYEGSKAHKFCEKHSLSYELIAEHNNLQHYQVHAQAKRGLSRDTAEIQKSERALAVSSIGEQYHLDSKQKSIADLLMYLQRAEEAELVCSVALDSSRLKSIPLEELPFGESVLLRVTQAFSRLNDFERAYNNNETIFNSLCNFTTQVFDFAEDYLSGDKAEYLKFGMGGNWDTLFEKVNKVNNTRWVGDAYASEIVYFDKEKNIIMDIALPGWMGLSGSGYTQQCVARVIIKDNILKYLVIGERKLFGMSGTVGSLRGIMGVADMADNLFHTVGTSVVNGLPVGSRISIDRSYDLRVFPLDTEIPLEISIPVAKNIKLFWITVSVALQKGALDIYVYDVLSGNVLRLQGVAKTSLNTGMIGNHSYKRDYQESKERYNSAEALGRYGIPVDALDFVLSTEYKSYISYLQARELVVVEVMGLGDFIQQHGNGNLAQLGLNVSSVNERVESYLKGVANLSKVDKNSLDKQSLSYEIVLANKTQTSKIGKFTDLGTNVVEFDTSIMGSFWRIPKELKYAMFDTCFFTNESGKKKVNKADIRNKYIDLDVFKPGRLSNPTILGDGGEWVAVQSDSYMKYTNRIKNTLGVVGDDSGLYILKASIKSPIYKKITPYHLEHRGEIGNHTKEIHYVAGASSALVFSGVEKQLEAHYVPALNYVDIFKTLQRLSGQVIHFDENATINRKPYTILDEHSTRRNIKITKIAYAWDNHIEAVQKYHESQEFLGLVVDKNTGVVKLVAESDGYCVDILAFKSLQQAIGFVNYLRTDAGETWNFCNRLDSHNYSKEVDYKGILAITVKDTFMDVMWDELWGIYKAEIDAMRGIKTSQPKYTVFRVRELREALLDGKIGETGDYLGFTEQQLSGVLKRVK